MNLRSNSDKPLILASGSPRRRELLGSLGIPFEIVVPGVDEGAFKLDHLAPEDIVKFLARTKAQEVFKQRPEAVVIGCDTIVVLDGLVYGKPVDADDAFRMLRSLAGRAHQVYSGIALFSPDRDDVLCDFRQTDVTMRAMTDDEIRAYVATGEPMDKAGAYAIQGLGATLIDTIDGCYFNVVGMSLVLLARMLLEISPSAR